MFNMAYAAQKHLNTIITLFQHSKNYNIDVVINQSDYLKMLIYSLSRIIGFRNP